VLTLLARIPAIFFRNLSAALLGCALLAAPAFAIAADRGPSTPEERKQALGYIQHFMADPLNPALKSEIRWVVGWAIEIPDVHVSLCNIIELPMGNKKDGQTLITAMVLAQTAFALQNPDKQNDELAQYQAGVEGVLRVYELLMKDNPKDHQLILDDLIQRRDAGTLPQWIMERAANCHK
jgi:hypothetical protein